MKKCKICEKILNLNNFYLDKRGIYSSRCKKCHSLQKHKCIVCNKAFVGHINKKLCSLKCKRIYRPQTFKNCVQCGKGFGPVNKLMRKFCSRKCKIEFQKTGCIQKQCNKEAKRAQRRVAYAIQKGVLVRPKKCSNCGKKVKTEAAHYDYKKPLQVKWLCSKCHNEWDKKYPKGGV